MTNRLAGIACIVAGKGRNMAQESSRRTGTVERNKETFKRWQDANRIGGSSLSRYLSGISSATPPAPDPHGSMACAASSSIGSVQ
jgi:hypothetical protein